MNGAESIVKSLKAAGIDRCFANPGTSEMHFLGALDRIGGIDCALCLFEGVVTGAADGYARMTGTPAVTLLHCGPGLANGLANLHNARRARVPMLNIVGDHARDHVKYDTPLTSDTEAVAATFSNWVRKVDAPEDLAGDLHAALTATMDPAGGVATLVLPADIAWSDGPAPLTAPPAPPAPVPVPEEMVAEAVQLIERGAPVLFFVTGGALAPEGARALGRLARHNAVEVLSAINGARYERGAGRADIPRIPYGAAEGRQRLAHFKHVFLVGTSEPASFFAYPGQPGSMVPEGCAVHRFSDPGMDAVPALAEIADRLGLAPDAYDTIEFAPTAPPSGVLTPQTIAAAIAATLPENAIICDEGLTQGAEVMGATRHCLPHSWIQITGGAIGNGFPLALGAAIGAPDRRVIAVQADGSGLFTLQSLWSQAREGANVTTVVLSNGRYEILNTEMKNIGIDTPGPLAQQMMTLNEPTIDWMGLSRGFGVPAAVAEDAETLMALLHKANAAEGPFLIEAKIL